MLLLPRSPPPPRLRPPSPPARGAAARRALVVTRRAGGQQLHRPSLLRIFASYSLKLNCGSGLMPMVDHLFKL
jgi:hypothetical protein